MTHEIKTEKALRHLIGNPVHELVVAKTTPIITAPIRRYIERSPFVCLATYGIDGACDLSPRGDPPGFVKVLNEKTLFLLEFLRFYFVGGLAGDLTGDATLPLL